MQAVQCFRQMIFQYTCCCRNLAADSCRDMIQVDFHQQMLFIECIQLFCQR